jgi:general secretion pathway protein A
MDLKSTFGFHTIPFTRELGTDDAFALPLYEQARDGLLRAIDKRMSAALISPAGTGKTTVLRGVIARLPEARYRVHYVKCTSLSKRDMCREIARACAIPLAGSYPMLVHRLQERFETDLADQGHRPVLVLDEAHDLRPDVLAMLRVLTNFQMDSRLVLSIVLAGQPDLGKMLGRDDQDAIARRIAHYATLRSLSRDEIGSYVAHRCSIAGARQTPFDASALDALFEIGRGNLRATDNLALEALEMAARAKLPVVSAQYLAAARKVLWP